MLNLLVLHACMQCEFTIDEREKSNTYTYINFLFFFGNKKFYDVFAFELDISLKWCFLFTIIRKEPKVLTVNAQIVFPLAEKLINLHVEHTAWKFSEFVFFSHVLKANKWENKINSNFQVSPPESSRMKPFIVLYVQN